MKHLQYLILGGSILFTSNSLAQQLAFPGAVGFGAYASGGRAGTVYHVTNLNDSGEGSFRDAVSKSGRIVVFDIGGNIRLKTAVQVQGDITIAGQTAPGGIAIDGGKISCGSKSNIIIRHIRVRPGSETASTKDDGINMYRSKNCIIDHCSVEFSPWNNIGGSGSNDNKSTDITFQYCLIANPIYQQFGAHIESVNSQWTWFANCFANTHNRNPLDKVNDVFVNNINYNYQAAYTTHTSTKFSHDIINNCFVSGPTSGSTDNTWFQVDKNQSIYYKGNIKDRNNDGKLNGAETTPYWYQGTGVVLNSPWSAVTNSLPIMSANTAYYTVASLAGAQPLDEIDTQVWNDVRSLGKSGKMYKSQTETGLSNDGYGTIKGLPKPTDSDGDGMPDYWEKAMGLDLQNNDAMKIAENGYANIENYINFLADLHHQTKMNEPILIDLSQYGAGWSSVSPSYSVSDGKDCKLTLAGTKVHVTPAPDFYGLASFKFTIKGSDNSTNTFTVQVLVEPEEIVKLPANLTKHGGGSSSQTINLGEEITKFNFTWSRAETINIEWTPYAPKGLNVTTSDADTTIYFSGTPTEAGEFSYTITTVGNDEPASRSGKIVVINPTKISMANTDKPIIYYSHESNVIEINCMDFVRADIYSALGVLLKSLTNKEIDISNLPCGMCIVKITTHKGVVVERFIKK